MKILFSLLSLILCWVMLWHLVGFVDSEKWSQANLSAIAALFFHLEAQRFRREQLDDEKEKKKVSP